ncbi:alcohol dehydrogenase catalytic domain-containing protein [Paenibacillus hamazuiensis]|uniref:alcohol dehydrogenase catalytic domain-containing protein n=1 Tax=Paenibacillus hamazuiensis TaxID=2936508 RepID=UPI00200DAA21|nr:alcohol dehydrogenase catalytic domain-containing protein [Paenibacillus hamazuiensis]
MKAAQFLGEDKIKLVETGIPALTSEDDVIVKVSCCGLCGSDKRLFHNGAGHIPGHEIAGVVAHAGANATIKPGTRVIIYIPIFCGECKYCAAGETNRCQHIQGLVGWQRDGGYAEYVRVPARNVIPIPDDLTDSDGVLLLDTVGTAAHAIRLAKRSLASAAVGDKVLVIGCGPLGLGTVLTLKAFGFTRIYAADPSEERLSVAKEFGAEEYVADPESLAGEFAIVIEASGSAPGRKTAIYAVEPGGAVVILGESNDPFVIQPTPTLRRKDFSMIRSFYFDMNEVAENIELYRSNQRSFQRLVSKIVPFEQLEETFVEFCQGKTIKPFVRL